MSKLQELLLSLFIYDQWTGDFLWKKNGKFAGWIDNGYQRFQIGNSYWFAHTAIWVIMTGEWSEERIDHIDCDGVKYGYGNRWSNLRLSTNQENSRNRVLNGNSTSGFTGVSWNKKAGKWIAHITVDYKTLRIGTYETKSDAIEARQVRELLLFKDFSPKRD